MPALGAVFLLSGFVLSSLNVIVFALSYTLSGSIWLLSHRILFFSNENQRMNGSVRGSEEELGGVEQRNNIESSFSKRKNEIKKN